MGSTYEAPGAQSSGFGILGRIVRILILSSIRISSGFRSWWHFLGVCERGDRVCPGPSTYYCRCIEFQVSALEAVEALLFQWFLLLCRSSLFPYCEN